MIGVIYATLIESKTLFYTLNTKFWFESVLLININLCFDIKIDSLNLQFII